MARSRRSLQLTEAYRERLAATTARAQALCASFWPTIEQLDDSDFAARATAALTSAQVEVIRLSAGYLAAFVTSEIGRRVRAQTPDTRRYAGLSRSGRPLSESLAAPIIGVRVELGEGVEFADALAHGRARALRLVEADLAYAARESLRELMEADPHVGGWQRSVRGTCGACMGDIEVVVSVELPSQPLSVHPNCQCVTQPVVSGVPDRFALATGAERFARMTRSEQNDSVGPQAADRLRAGDIGLADLVATAPMATQDDFITQKPLKDLVATTQEVN